MSALVDSVVITRETVIDSANLAFRLRVSAENACGISLRGAK
jgi:hypothetical protein